MIGFFPQLYLDELWYSAIMRYHLHAGIAYWSDTLQLLFPDCSTYPKVGELLPQYNDAAITARAARGDAGFKGAGLASFLVPVPAAVLARR